MKTIGLRLASAALTCSLGVSAVFIRGAVGEVKVSAPDTRLLPDSVVPLKKCEVHDAVMGMDRVPVEYGLRFGEPEAKRRLFPHSNSFIDGGCEVRNKKRSTVLFCPLCRAAESEWVRLNGKY